MPFQVGTGCLPAVISDSSINQIARSDTSPDVSVWEKIKVFFCSTNKPKVLELIRQICYPSTGTTRGEVAGRFEQLRTLAYGSFEENVQFGRHGENYFCILDANSREILSVTLDDTGKYTVKCQGHCETHHLIPDTEPGEECAEHAEGAAGTLRAEHTATTAPDYETVWSTWEKAAPAGESPHRAEAVRKMLNCLNNGRTELNLRDFGLTTLPDLLPPNLTALNTIRVPLHYLPPLPEGLRSLCVSNNLLTSLPEALPPELEVLWANGNQLARLPVLPEGLRSLFVMNNQLTSLPVLPEGLRSLFVMNNQLTSLPVLPEGLQQLDVNNNQLTSLPEALPERLQQLEVKNNQLTSLPEALPPELEVLWANGNQLAHLPESIANLSTSAIVNLENNPLSERTLQVLQDMTRAPGYSGPTIHFSMVGPSAPQEARPLHLAVADWLAPAKEGESTPTDRWESFGQENDTVSFSAFLDRLSETENFRKDPGFKTQVATWLTQLAKNDELRAKTFAMATEATSSCEDRVTLALNQMKNVQLVYDAEKGKYDNNLPGLFSAGREMFRLEKLEQIARVKASTLRFVDEIEVYLAYQNKLKEPLELSSVSAEMRFFGISGVTDSDLQTAEIQVKTAENDRFGEWILQWAPLRSVLERAYPEDWETLTEKKISDYDDAYRMLSDTELKPAGLTGNADAERAVGARALESAEQAFHAGLRPLADRMLGGHLKALWS